MKYFQKTFRPDIIDGAIAKVIGSDGGDAPFSQGDILFDWQAIDIPLGTDAIIDAIVHMYGEDGGSQVNDDFNLLIAKSNNGVAPTTLGNENGQLSGCFELPDVLMGIMKFEADTNRAGKLNLGGHGGSIYHFNVTGNQGHVGPVVIEPEHNALGGQATNRIYVAGISGGEFDFSTGVLLNNGSNVADDSTTTLDVDGVDPRKAFRVGDTVYKHNSNTPIGTIASLTVNTIVLTSNNVGGVDDNEEFMNAKPITVTLGFKGRG